jgi:hypothetical protein
MNMRIIGLSGLALLLGTGLARAAAPADSSSIWTLEDENASVSAAP